MEIKNLLIDKIERGRVWLKEKEKEYEMEFDFSKNTLFGVKVNNVLDSVVEYELSEGRILSPKCCHRYYFKGVEFYIENGSPSIFLVWRKYWYEQFTALYGHFTPYQGICKFNGTEVPINSSTSEMEFIEIFGKPHQRQEDEYEIVLFYEFDGYEWQVIFTLNKELSAILIIYQ